MDFTKNHDIMCFALRCKFRMRREIILNTSFMKENMNEITKKLLGLSDDELSTTEPSRDENGIYMIFHLLYIEFEDFNKFISFLKIKYMKESDFEQVMLISNILGGFDVIDKYIENFYKKKALPQKPSDDIDNKFIWKTARITSSDSDQEYLDSCIEDGFTLTDEKVDGSDRHMPIMFLRKEK